jgi:hypothetical protein
MLPDRMAVPQKREGNDQGENKEGNQLVTVKK